MTNAMKKNIIKEEALVSSLLAQINSLQDDAIIELNRQANTFQKNIGKIKSDIGQAKPESVRKWLNLAIKIGKAQLKVIDNIGVSDIPKLEAVKMNIAMLKAALAELDIMVAMLNTSRKDAKFAENPMNSENMADEKELPKDIKTANATLSQIEDAIQELINDMNLFNKKIQVKVYELNRL